jgi:hypothetical protein
MHRGLYHRAIIITILQDETRDSLACGVDHFPILPQLD